MSNNKDFKVKNGIQPTVYHEGLGTVVSGSVGYNLAGASYDSVSFNGVVSTRDCVFKPDGTKMFTVSSNDDLMHEYDLSTAWDVSTATQNVSSDLDVSTQGATSLFSLAFKSDGTKCYACDNGTSSIYQYTLSTAWDLSTASFDSSLSVNSNGRYPHGFVLKTDGTSFYVLGTNVGSVYQYDMSTAYDISTASYASKSLTLTTAYEDIEISSDGTTLYALLSGGVDTVNQYTLSTAWDISTATDDSISFYIGGQELAPEGVTVVNSGKSMYITGTSTIYQYSTALITAELDLSTGSVFDYTPTSDVQVTLSNPAASGTVSGATLLLSGGGAGYSVDGGSYDNVSFSTASQGTSGYGFFFKPDGTKFYTTDFSNNAVYQYDLSTAWDITTATYSSNSLSVTQAIELHFRSDGLRLMVIDDGDTVKQYSLSTAWDLSTASYDNKSFSVSGQDTSVYSFFFKDDGTKMYIGGNINDSVFQYTLSTAWDISTASYDSVSFSVAATLAGAPTAMYFKPDGTSMFLTRNSTKLIEYPLSTAWDLSTASYTGVFYESFSTSIGGGSNPEVYGLSFKDDGTKFYVFASGSASLNSVYQFSSVAGYTITYDPTLEWPGGTAPTAPAIGETDVVTFNTRDGGSTYQGVLAIDGAK